jgi:diacylglycerol O-acyltransferase / wax synthase
VPGPQLPLYLLGSRMIEIYPVVPLLDGLGLGIALFSYDGKLCWGFNADYDLVPDLEPFVQLVREAADELLAVARRAQPLPKPGPKRRRRQAAPGPPPVEPV